ncbi:hypothetical protein PACTADRAFT_1782 [Pachysolen tannophilus NRRL Y-2460]|uniref:Uncharacterized protein n=1 Tax=Pachysolen tannophilus NRRL Y-2460 TaxID=669874 RepID=A0A1E4TZP9_PACTA|nr:hypothetical protein PACTADRAFT_1782 [Pachysolen tannophilus NRRL Y-2460]
MERDAEAHVIGDNDNNISSYDSNAKLPSEQRRGRQFQIAARYEYNNTKNIPFRGTTAERALSQQSRLRNDSTHSFKNTTRNNSKSSFVSNHKPIPTAKVKHSLLLPYNENTVSDTVVPGNLHSNFSRYRSHSRQSSASSNYTFQTEATSTANLREKQRSIVEYQSPTLTSKSTNKNVDNWISSFSPEFELEDNKERKSNNKNWQKHHQHKKSLLNYSYTAFRSGSLESSNKLDEEGEQKVDNFFPAEQLYRTSSSPDRRTSQSQSSNASSPATNVSYLGISPSTNQLTSNKFDDVPLRTLQRQLNARDYFNNINEHEAKQSQEDSLLANKWNKIISLNDRIMLETITNDLRRLIRFNGRPVIQSIKRAVDNRYINLQSKDNEIQKITKTAKGSLHFQNKDEFLHENGKFKIGSGREQINQMWKELNDVKKISETP